MLPKVLDIASEFPTPAYEQWRALVEDDLHGAAFEKKLLTRTYEGLTIKPLYTAEDLARSVAAGAVAGAGAVAQGAASGVPPYTRGARSLAAVLAGWDIRQEHAEAEPEVLNAAILDDLENGVTSVQLRLDAASRRGLDPDGNGADGLVGVDGASLATAADWDRAFRGVHLGMITVGLEAGSAFVPGAAMLAALWERQGLSPGQCRGCFNADPLAVLAREGHLTMGLEESVRLAAELAVWAGERYPHVRAIRVGTAPYHHAGATATQDLAFSMATGLEYLRAMVRAGMSVDRACGQMLFSYAIGTGMFMAMAKLRAARRLWSRVVEVAGAGRSDAAAQRMVMNVRPSKRVLTTRDPWVNILRVTSCVFAAASAGADSITATAFDAPLCGPGASPSPLGRRIARNTQVILQEECHLHRVNDAAGGSYYVETLTEELARGAWEILQQIESRGGMMSALASGWISEQVRRARTPREANVASRRDAIIGVSEFANLGEQPPMPAPVDLATLRVRCAARVQAARPAWGATLDVAGATTAVARAWRAAAAGASIGQVAGIADVGIGGAHGVGATLGEALTAHPYGEAFEHLRDAADWLAEQCGQRPRVFLASVGTPAQHLARTTYSKGFFEAGGFATVGAEGDVEGLAEAFKGSGASIAVICGGDAQYADVVGVLAPALHRAGARTVVLAGHPGEKQAEYAASGVDRFIFVRCDVVKVLSELLAQEGAVL
jgi:methylmalonyl-CoA mutase